MNKWQADLVSFHEKFGLDISATPGFPPTTVEKLRINLIEEEMKETIKALEDGNLVEIADGITDAIYALLGTAVSYGIDINPVWREVHKTNMAKVGGKVREDGKILKPEGWTAPNIASILIKQGMTEK